MHASRLQHPLNLKLLETMNALQNLALETHQPLHVARLVGRRIAQVYERLYPANHPMVGLQWYRVGDVASLDDKPVEAGLYHHKARNNLAVCMGEEHRFVRQLDETLAA